MLSEEELLNSYIAFDRPVPYKQWYIKPISIFNLYSVHQILSLLDVDKNTLGNVEIIQMSFLKFVMMLMSSENEFQQGVNTLLRLALSIPDEHCIAFDLSDGVEKIIIGETVVTKSGREIVNDNTAQVITAEDFDEIKRIILYQNILNYTDRYVDPDVKKAADEYYRIKNKNSSSTTIEHQVVCIQAATGMSLESIGSLSIRKFQQLFNTIVEEKDYAIYKYAEANGAKFKKPIEHWAFKKHKDRYSDAFVDADAFIDEINSVN